jgi:V8-like Glu-specific endopeptidase
MVSFQPNVAKTKPPDGSSPSRGKDVAHASLPRLTLSKQHVQIVFDPDMRQPVVDTTAVPFRAIADLLIDVGAAQPELATGWFISPDVVVTAAHALSYQDPSGNRALAHSVSVIPGCNGAQSHPFGIFTATQIRVSAGWLPNLDPAADYGAVHLSQSVGNAVGWFGCGVFTDAQLGATAFNVTGYPTDKPLGTMWGEAGPIGFTPTFVSYKMSCYPGQSGSPVYVMIDGNAWVAGIHSGGQGSANAAVRITQSVFNELMTWKT